MGNRTIVAIVLLTSFILHWCNRPVINSTKPWGKRESYVILNYKYHYKDVLKYVKSTNIKYDILDDSTITFNYNKNDSTSYYYIIRKKNRSEIHVTYDKRKDKYKLRRDAVNVLKNCRLKD